MVTGATRGQSVLKPQRTLFLQLVEDTLELLCRSDATHE